MRTDMHKVVAHSQHLKNVKKYMVESQPYKRDSKVTIKHQLENKSSLWIPGNLETKSVWLKIIQIKQRCQLTLSVSEIFSVPILSCL